MKRRDLLKSLAAVPLGGGVFGQEMLHEATVDFGAVHREDKVTRNIRKNHPWIAGAGKRANIFLWKFYEQVAGQPFEPHFQGNWEDGRWVGVGDCVGQGTAASVDHLMATEIALHKDKERWVAKSSVSAIYAGARNEIAKNVYGHTHMTKHGAIPLFALEYLKKYGVLHRLNYEEQGVDLREYQVRRSLDWAFEGVPDELEPLAREHPVQQFSKVTTYAELSDALAAGQPVIIGSSYAVRDERDKDGFAELYTGERVRKGRRMFFITRKKWMHLMCFVGLRNGTKRPGVCLLNSHGPDWIEGPKTFGQPEGSCWITPEHAELMLKDWEDGYALSSYIGHPGNRIEKIKKHKLF